MNRWKNYLWMVAGLAALAVVGAFTAKPLLAQIKAAFVQNVDEPGRNPFHVVRYFGLSSSGFQCDSNNTCTASFGVVPTGKRLVVTNVSGLVFAATPGVVAYAEIYVTPTRGPEFRGVHLLEGIAEYQKRERRYGGLADSARRVKSLALAE